MEDFCSLINKNVYKFKFDYTKYKCNADKGFYVMVILHVNNS